MLPWKAPLCISLALLLPLSPSLLPRTEIKVAAPACAVIDPSFSKEEVRLPVQNAAKVPPDEAEISALSAVLIEAESGRLLWEKQAELPLPMASTTKVMTALTAVTLASPDTCIRVHPDAVGVEGSSVYLVENEELTLEQLLYALLLESANDAAAAIAIGLCGSIGAFAEEMNRYADRLGLVHTHFCNPHGLDEEAHYTTAADLAALTREALRVPLLCRILASEEATVPHPSLGSERHLHNHNRLLQLYAGCIGGKTGYTKKSGRCLVSAAERDGVTLIAVTLRAPNDWEDHGILFDYGFSCLRSLSLCDAGELPIPIPTVGGLAPSVTAVTAEALRITLPASLRAIRVTQELPHFAYAPVASGDRLGYLVLRGDADGDGLDEILAKVPLIAQNSVEQIPKKRSLLQWIKSLFGLL